MNRRFFLKLVSATASFCFVKPWAYLTLAREAKSEERYTLWAVPCESSKEFKPLTTLPGMSECPVAPSEDVEKPVKILTRFRGGRVQWHSREARQLYESELQRKSCAELGWTPSYQKPELNLVELEVARRKDRILAHMRTTPKGPIKGLQSI